MHIRLNGKTLEYDSPLSLTDLLQRYGITLSTGRVAVACNEQIIFRSQWDSFIVQEGDRIEIIYAVQGG
jgi:sulfur carrier protein